MIPLKLCPARLKPPEHHRSELIAPPGLPIRLPDQPGEGRRQQRLRGTGRRTSNTAIIRISAKRPFKMHAIPRVTAAKRTTSYCEIVSTINQAPTQFRAARTGRKNTDILRWARQLHLWLGVFFAPAIIFFAFSGALQTFSFHEAERGSTYQPPMWIQKIAQLHKKQNLQVRAKRPGPPPEGVRPEAPSRRKGGDAPQPPQQQSASTLLLKWFVFAMSLGLISTSALGVYMAFQYNRSRRLIWSLLLLGTAIPMVPMLIQ